MNDTPRTDAESFPDFERGGDVVLAEFARALERELADAKRERDQARAIARDQRKQLDKGSSARLIFPWE